MIVYPLQIAYVDVNNDAKIDVLIPVALSNGSTFIWMFDWPHYSFTNLTPEGKDLKLIPAKGEIPLRIHYGDFDQDGYIDGLAIVKRDSKNAVRILH